jgi:hypothetical protein
MWLLMQERVEYREKAAIFLEQAAIIAERSVN